MAFAVWWAEKEFGFPIGKDFPLMKLLMLLDEDNAEEYNRREEEQMKRRGGPKTLR